MPPFLAAILLNPRVWLAAGIGAVALGAFIYVQHLRGSVANLTARNSTLELQLSDAQRIARDNAMAVQRIKNEKDAELSAVAASHRATLERLDESRAILKDIDDARNTDKDAPLPDAALRYLERLRNGASGAGAGHRSGEAAPAAGVAPVPR